MKKKMFTLGLCLSVLFNATAAVCSAAPNEVLDKDGIAYVMDLKVIILKMVCITLNRPQMNSENQ